MPVHLEHVDRARCTLVMTGVITADDIRRAIELQIVAGAWECETVYDATAATGCVMGFVDIQELTRTADQMAQARPPRGPVVIVAPNEVVYGCARMYQANVEGQVPMRIEVVRTMADGEAWLAGQESRR